MDEKKILKSIAKVLCVIILLFAVISCQSTPKELVVISKAGEEFQEAIAETADEAVSELAKIEHVESELVNDIGNITVKVDAEVSLPRSEKIPIANISKKMLSQEQLNNVVDALADGAKLYDASVKTKESIEKNILRIKREATDMDSDLAQSNGITSFAELQELANMQITELEKQLSDAPPHEAAYVEKIDVSSEMAMVSIDVGKDYDATLAYSNIGFSMDDPNRIQEIIYTNFGDIWLQREVTSKCATEMVGNTLDDSEFKNAYQKAMNLIAEMKMGNVALLNSYISCDSTSATNGEEGESLANLGNEYYVFSFARMVNGVPIVSAFYEGTGSENGNTIYSAPLPNERIEIWIEGDELAQFVWKAPMQVDDIINENVEININLDEALKLMANSMFVSQNAFYGDSEVQDVLVEIERVELNLASIRKKGETSAYITVPVWDFYGNIKVKYSHKYFEKYDISEKDIDENGYMLFNSENIFKSLCTINALDGTTIDRNIGY